MLANPAGICIANSETGHPDGDEYLTTPHPGRGSRTRARDPRRGDTVMLAASTEPKVERGIDERELKAKVSEDAPGSFGGLPLVNLRYGAHPLWRRPLLPALLRIGPVSETGLRRRA
jgi:hypothetical protein